MVRSRLTYVAAVIVAAAMMNLAGCPQGDSLTPANVQPDTSAEDVFAVLGETLSAGEMNDAQFSSEVQSVEVTGALTPETGSSSMDATAEAVPFDAIDLDPNDVIGDTLVRGGLIRSHGGLAGRFVNDDPNANSDEVGGEFHGRWFSAEGEVRGVVRGEFRPATPDNLPPGLAGGGVFNGRYIDSDGHFRGFLRGRYGHREGARGFFFGRWLDRNHRLVGVVKGHWDEEPGAGGGMFRGRWAAFNICDEAASMPESDLENLSPDTVDAVAGLTLTDAALTQAEGVDIAPADDVEILDETDVGADVDGPCINPDAPYGFLRGWYRPVRPQDDPNDPGDPNDPNAPGPRHGVMRGHWYSVSGRIGGRLLGRWVAIDEEPGDGPRVLGHFNAHYLSRSGEIRGSIHGAYGVSEHGLRIFRGRYFDADGEPLGAMAGRWGAAPNRPGGPFFGMWVGVDFGDGE